MNDWGRFRMVRLGGLELPTFWFVARRSIQLSYRRTVNKYYHRVALGFQSRQKADFRACGKTE
jgi:hypothetical protein